MPENIVNYKVEGNSGPYLVILHGLFGSLDNWQTLANDWSEKYQVVLADARNHGKSFHSDTFTYQAMAEDVIRLLDHLNIDSAHFIGHSMGGKTLMHLSQIAPERINKMIVADIGPKAYPPHHDTILEAFESVDLDSISSRGEAAKAVEKVISDKGVALFLLKNLYWKEKGRLAWKINLPVLKREISRVVDAVPKKEVNLPCLFIRGNNSNYILNDDWPDIKEQFTKAHLVSLKNAGHWLHAEQPDAFYNTVNAYLEA